MEEMELSLEDDETNDGSLRQWAMTARTKDNDFLFNSVKRGIRCQTYYLCDKEMANEAEEWLDATFNKILADYGANRCLKILGGIHHIRREKNVRTTPHISAYLKGLDLSSSKEGIYKGKDMLSNPPPSAARWHGAHLK